MNRLTQCLLKNVLPGFLVKIKNNKTKKKLNVFINISLIFRCCGIKYKIIFQSMFLALFENIPTYKKLLYYINGYF